VLLLLFGCNDAPEGEPVPEPEVPDEPAPGETVYTLDQDLTWSEDTLVSGVWYVAAGVTLRIQAGVEVSFLPATGLIVDGVLDLAGTPEEPVTFVNAATLSVGNFGVSVGGDGDLSNLDNASFTGVSLYLEGGASASIVGSSFSDASLSVSSRSAPFLVDNCSFVDGQRDFQTGVVARDLNRLDVISSSFSRLFRGVQFDGSGEAPVLNVTGSSFSDLQRAVHSGTAGVPHTVVVDTVTVTDTDYHSLEFYNAEVTVRDTTVEGSGRNCIFADSSSSLAVSDTTLTDCESYCVVAYGGVEADNLAVSACSDSGILVGPVGGVIRDSTVVDTDSYGIYAEGPLTVENSSVQDSGRTGIYVIDGDATVLSTTITAARGSGAHSYNGAVTVVGSTISDVEASGVYAQYGTLTIADSTVSDARGYGLRTYRGDVVVQAGTSGVSIVGVDSHGVVASEGGITAVGLAVTDTGGIGVSCDGGDLSLSNTAITGTASHGVSVTDGNALIVSTDGSVVVESVGGTGVLVSGGNLSAEGLEVRNSFAAGVDVYNGQGLVSDCTIEGAGSDGISGRQSPLLSVASCTISGSYNYGVKHSSGGNLVVTGSSVDGSGLGGIYGYRVGVQVTTTSVVASGSHGIYVYDGGLSVSNSTVANSTLHGIYSYLGDLSVDQSQVVDQSQAGDQPSAGSNGISVILGQATISNTLVDKASSYGVNIQSGTISASTISNGGYTGVLLSGHDVSSITGSNIANNSFRGIQTTSIAANLCDIVGNNITGNADWGLVYGQSVTGNYIADNRGQSGPDTGSGGTLDGVRDTTSTQVLQVDELNAAQSVPVTGTGPAPI